MAIGRQVELGVGGGGGRWVGAGRRVRVAGVQVEGRNFDVEGNLRRAERLVAVAVGRGAEVVVCPEFLATGYIYERAIWKVAERRGGVTEGWLVRMAREHGVYIGASYLEACGEDFFNTFTLVGPGGEVAGRVRKETLPGFEGWFFRGCSGPKVIETGVGRIGVGICWDNVTGKFMRRVSEARLDLLVMPHSAPTIRVGPVWLVGKAGRERLRGVAGFYARELGVPVVMVNKAAGEDTESRAPWLPGVRLGFHFMGESVICEAGGGVCDRLGEEEGVVVAEVVVGDEGKRREARVPEGYWAWGPERWGRVSAGVFRVAEGLGKVAYTLSRARRLAAREVPRRLKATSALVE